MALLFVLSSCASTITSQLISPALKNMQQQSDIELVCEGTPSYLLMIDSLIAGEKSEQFLQLGITSYAGYIGAIEECGASPGRIAAMADKAFSYSTMLMSQELSLHPDDSFDIFNKNIQKLKKKDTANLFWSSFGWIAWLQRQQGSPVAMAGLSKIEKMLLRVIELDEQLESGGAHFLLGAYYGSRPPLLGGDPQKSSFHFEKALHFSNRRQLIYQTVYAETYSRMTFNRKHHDELLTEVLEFDLDSAPENTLANKLAKEKATRLLADGFFD